jgi:hypothetical protein
MFEEHAEHLGKFLDGFGIALVFKAHHEVYGIAMDSATETVIGISGGADKKRRSPFIMERATGHIVSPFAFEVRYIARDNVHDVGSIVDLLNG